MVAVGCILGSDECTGESCADMNGDGTVDVLDIVSMVNCIVDGNCGD